MTPRERVLLRRLISNPGPESNCEELDTLSERGLVERYRITGDLHGWRATRSGKDALAGESVGWRKAGVTASSIDRKAQAMFEDHEAGHPNLSERGCPHCRGR